tara:strand:+ start:8355 stop:8576 length:222 start_codon:yes stop_codon:yes gene_type:complete
MLISAYVFMVAARNYVSEDEGQHGRERQHFKQIARNTEDRRSGVTVSFPLMVNGILIEHDRRVSADRRRAAAH